MESKSNSFRFLIDSVKVGLLVAILAYSSTSANAQNCSAGEVACLFSDECIKADHMCDGEWADCKNGEDEIGCPCPSGQFQCPDEKCIPQEWKCDCDKDCADSSDEGLPECKPCPPCVPNEEFACDLGRCIIAAYCCDGIPDCGDDSDETLEACTECGKPFHGLREHYLSKPDMGSIFNRNHLASLPRGEQLIALKLAKKDVATGFKKITRFDSHPRI